LSLLVSVVVFPCFSLFRISPTLDCLSLQMRHSRAVIIFIPVPTMRVSAYRETDFEKPESAALISDARISPEGLDRYIERPLFPKDSW